MPGMYLYSDQIYNLQKQERARFLSYKVMYSKVSQYRLWSLGVEDQRWSEVQGCISIGQHSVTWVPSSLSSQNFLFPVILPSQECKPLLADILLWLYLEHLKHAINILEI